MVTSDSGLTKYLATVLQQMSGEEAFCAVLPAPACTPRQQALPQNLPTQEQMLVTTASEQYCKMPP